MLGWAFWVIFWGYLFSVWVVCVHFILFIKLFLSVYCLNLCRATFAVWITKRTSCRSYWMMKSLMLCIKETIIFIKIQNTNTLNVKTCPQSCWLFVVEQVMKAIAVHFIHEWSAGRWSHPWSVPAEHDSSSAREPAPLRWKHSYRAVHLLVNYIGLMFNLYF